MDKKTIIGLVLMVAVFVGFSFYQGHEAEKYAEYRKELAKQQQEQMLLKAAEEEAAGRKLGFIAQELGREINTMGSKSNEANMQRLVVQMKDELEKIKEQVLNIL